MTGRMRQKPGKAPGKIIVVDNRDVRLTNAGLGRAKGGIRLSLAAMNDIAALQVLERRTFSEKKYDQMSENSMRHMVRGGNGAMILAWEGATLRGYILLLFRRNSRKARLGSIAVDPSAQGRGIGAVLSARAERTAKKAGCDSMLLEIRADNKRQEKSYYRRGYTLLYSEKNYFPDGCACLKFSGLL